ncbi:MAG: relaxase/mobilization nuclease domain-containing protein [Erythrobacter sp.]|nr:relaxase/mobilization nuclease domain-containing protein [Erythrobacter sp.]
MVPKIHANGSSFKGIAQYLLHDPDRAPTSDRVAWTQTLNLASDDPNLAWKLMAATALDADRLKAEAGVKNTGRKSNKSVLHFTLRWSGDEEAPIPEEMMRAARQAIKSLGAEDYQALIVAHSDKDPHIHCVINRVSMDTGKMLSSSKEKLNLSKWALGYEKERGPVLCQQREINWRARDRGEHTRGEKDIPRHVFEQIRSNDNTMSREQVKGVWKQHRGKDSEVGKRQRATKRAQSEAWAKLQSDHKDRQAAIKKQLGSDIFKAEQRVRDEYRSTWAERYQERQAQLKAFERDEKQLKGPPKRLGFRQGCLADRIPLGQRSGAHKRDAR